MARALFYNNAMINKPELIDRWKHKEVLYLDDGARRAFIAGVIATYAESNDSIIEIGCNAGSNLLALQRVGFNDLGGVDISSAAIRKASERVPGGVFICGDLREAIKEIWTADVLFSMAVLMHIHPDDEAVFQLFHERTRKYLITCEWEKSGNQYIEARDYGKVFAEHFDQVEIMDNLQVDGIAGYTLRVFKVKE
jgi:SAM-dependent methyltransferase